MVVSSYLVDSDILVDWINGMEWAKTLFWKSDLRLYCSNVSRKELLSKRGLKDSERKKILRLFTFLRVIRVDSTIATAAFELMQKYSDQPLRIDDALIAATAWVKHLPLLTRNRRHYEFIQEIELASW